MRNTYGGVQVLDGTYPNKAVIAGGGVEFVNSSTGFENFSDTETFSHTVSAGDNLLLLVGVGRYTNPDVSSVTYNGDALAQWADEVRDTKRISLWYMVNPDVGTANVVITLASSVDRIAGVALTFINVNQSTPLDAAETHDSDGTTDPTVTVASASGDLVADFIVCGDGAITIGADQTLRATMHNSPANVDSSTQPGAASVVMSWSDVAVFENSALIGVNINAA